MTSLLHLLSLPCLSFLLSLLLTPLARFLALRCHLVDQPDGHRKLHVRSIPLAGGLAIFLASCLTLGATLCLAPPELLLDNGEAWLLPGLLLACLVICLVGVVDDYGCLRGRQKLCGQMIAVGIIMLFGLHIRTVHFFGWSVELGLFSLPFTGLFLLGAINSLNLLDGMDGLLGSVGAVICAGIAVMAALGGHWVAAAVAATLTGAVLGFLRYNLPPASVFLGDAGSMLIGLVVGVLAIQSSLKGPATMVLTAPLALLTIPFFDTLAAIIRRKLTGRSLYTTDRGHLHHCLERRGFTGYRVLFVVGGLSLVTSGGALCSMISKNELVALLAALVVVSTLVVTRLFGHAEASLLHTRFRMVLLSLVQIRSRGPIDETIRLQGSAPWSEHWGELTACTKKLKLRSIRLDVHAPLIGEGYHARWEHGVNKEEENLWCMDIPLVAKGKIVGRVRMSGERDGVCVSEKVAVIANIIDEIETTIVALASWQAPSVAGLPVPALAQAAAQAEDEKTVIVGG